MCTVEIKTYMQEAVPTEEKLSPSGALSLNKNKKQVTPQKTGATNAVYCQISVL